MNHFRVWQVPSVDIVIYANEIRLNMKKEQKIKILALLMVGIMVVVALVAAASVFV